MKRLFNTNYSHRSLDIILLIFRVSIALLMLTHGVTKLNMLLAGGAIKFPDPLGVGATASLAMTVFAEVVCSVFILIGFATRLAVLPLIFNMLIVILVVTAGGGLEKQEAGIHYLLAYLVLLFAGPGSISIDKILNRRSGRSRRGY